MKDKKREEREIEEKTEKLVFMFEIEEEKK
jgi:hypothetical protein